METAIEILIDHSTSMKNKVELVRTVLVNDVIPQLEFADKIGLKTFTASNDKKPTITTILPTSSNTADDLISAVKTLTTPEGNTPIAAAIADSVKSLKGFSCEEKRIVLVTDGEENCNGDFLAEANKAKDDGVECQIHIIGIGLTGKALEQASLISSLTKGSFSNIGFQPTTAYDVSTIKQSIAPLTTMLKSRHISTASPGPQRSSNNVQHKTSSIHHSAEAYVVQNQKTDTLPRASNQSQPTTFQLEDDQEFNERIRKASEAYIFSLLQKKYPNRVKWLNQDGESYSDHDFEIIDLDGSIEYYIECKGTPQTKKTFYLTKSEWHLFLSQTKNYQVYFVMNSMDAPSHTFIDNLLDWILKAKVIPCVPEPQAVQGERIFLTVV